MNPNVTVSEIRNKIQDKCIVRTKLEMRDKSVFMLTLDSTDPFNYMGVVDYKLPDKFSKEWEDEILSYLLL